MKLDKRTTAVLSILFGILIFANVLSVELLVAVYLILNGALHFLE